MNNGDLLSVQGLSVRFQNGGPGLQAVLDLSFSIRNGEMTAIIGESGCGKSVAAHAIMSLLPSSAEVHGSVLFEGREILGLSETELNLIRGRGIAILFQSPDRSLNPLYRIERQIFEPLDVHRVNGSSKNSQIVHALTSAGFPNPDNIRRLYPCFCSGGMNQRSILAVASAAMPLLLIADEPTKGLDPSRIYEVESTLIHSMHKDRSVLLITHDIPLAGRVADVILVMYAGEVVESGRPGEILADPVHPYTRGLLGSLPEHGFIPIPGSSPPLSDLPSGCRFHPRCFRATPECRDHHPPLIRIAGREVRCLHS